MSTNTSMHIQPYADRHFLKDFQKKYKTARESTYITIFHMLEHIHNFLKTSLIEEIHTYGQYSILKVEFSISWSQTSPHASGNRMIILRDKENNTFDVLLIYMKTHIPKKQKETVRRKQTIKNNYDFIKQQFPSL